MTVRGHVFGVEVVETNLERAKGLMSRLYLAPDRGMVFAYDREQLLNFWMKNTLLSLDIVFLDAQKKVVSIQRNALPCKADPCWLYPSGAPAQYILELNAGMADRIHLSIGDQMY